MPSCSMQWSMLITWLSEFLAPKSYKNFLQFSPKLFSSLGASAPPTVEAPQLCRFVVCIFSFPILLGSEITSIMVSAFVGKIYPELIMCLSHLRSSVHWHVGYTFWARSGVSETTRNWDTRSLSMNADSGMGARTFESAPFFEEVFLDLFLTSLKSLCEIDFDPNIWLKIIM